MAEVQEGTNTTAQDPSYFQKLRNGEQHWAWKNGFRVAICVFDIVGIGCAGWLASRAANGSSYYTDYFYFDYFMLPAALTTVSIFISASSVQSYTDHQQHCSSLSRSYGA